MAIKSGWIMMILLVTGTGISLPFYAQTPAVTPARSQIERVKKGAKIVGCGLLAGGGAALLGGLGVWLLRTRHTMATRTVSDKVSLGIGLGFGASAAAGMLSYGIYGIKKSIYGQTAAEKQAEKEINDKVKETIKETGKVTLDISKRVARITGYSVATTLGIALGMLSVIKWVQFALRLSTKDFEKMKEGCVKEFQKNPKEFIGSHIIASPLGIILTAFGIHGLVKEYRSWKETKMHQTMAHGVQTIKDTVGSTVNGALDGAVNMIVPLDAQASVVSQVNVPKQYVDVAVQTEDIKEFHD